MLGTLTRTQKIVAGVAAIFLIGLAGWFVFDRRSSDEAAPEGAYDTAVSTEGSGSAVNISEIPVDLNLNADALARPFLNRPVVIPDNFSPEAATIVNGNIGVLKAQLEENPNSFQSWSDLAVQYKVMEDFEGAIEIWTYLSLVAGENTVPLINLGNVYHYELKDFEKAEEAFRKALAVDSKNPQAYIGLHELYRYSYKQDTTLAVDTVLDAMKALPDDLRLYQTLGNYYQDTGEIEKARETLLLGLDKARTAGDTNMVNTFTSMLERLPQ